MRDTTNKAAAATRSALDMDMRKALHTLAVWRNKIHKPYF